MEMDTPEFCEVNDCYDYGEKAHLVTRATVDKKHWGHPTLYVHLCRKHHTEQHSIGIETFLVRYGMLYKLHLAREFITGNHPYTP